MQSRNHSLSGPLFSVINKHTKIRTTLAFSVSNYTISFTASRGGIAVNEEQDDWMIYGMMTG
jgi:hypothetical protein